jgi:Zn-dependent M28 family amino/carboxypeptidase
MKVFASLFLFVFIGCSHALKTHPIFSDVKELSSDKYKGRKVGTAENAMAADYIIKRFREIGLKPYTTDYKMPFSFRDRLGNPVNGNNLVGYIAGKKADAIVISAHYDHVGVVNGQIYNGADDNASGIGALLSIATHFSQKQPEHTLVFAAFDAEESGLQGAKAYVSKPIPAMSTIRMNVNMDMVSRSKKNELYVAGTYHYPHLKGSVITTNKKIKLLFGHDNPALGRDDWTNQSDHGAFHAKKIPFLYFGVEDHEDYHRPTDDFSRIDKEFYKNAVSSILEVVKNLDKGITLQKIGRDKLIMQ